MLPNSHPGQHQPTSNNYPQSPRNSQAQFPVDSLRSRQNSDAMNIYSVTDREPNHRERPGNHWSNSASPTITVATYKLPEQHPNHVENGRTYHGFRKGVYMFPCDEQEKDRLDLFHRVITEARVGDGLIYSPHSPSGRVLDLGCGTGIWAIDVALKYRDSFVVGVDLSRIQPDNPPKNCDFYAPWDYETPWGTLGENYWDLIHLQMAGGSVASWPSLYRRACSHLRPGAWFEQVEIDFEPRCDGGTLDNTALAKWYQYLKQATEQTGRPLAHSTRETIKHLQDAGFVDVDHQMVGLPLNPWHSDEHEKTVGRWYNLAISESIETLSLAPFHRVFGWTVEQIRSLATEVKSEAFNREIHAYNILHIYQARKPPAN